MRRLPPFVKLPLYIDPKKLADEVDRFGEDEWRPHTTRFEGNSALILVSQNGEENDEFSGSMKPSPRLQKTPYVRQIMAAFDSAIGRSRLMRLAPGASVPLHTDSHYFWRDHQRIHIPVHTHPDVAFYCDGEQVHMAAGECWTFNNWLEHTVENRSSKTRIHLVIDTVGSSYFWRMVDGREREPRKIEYSDSYDPALRFEEYPGMPVMPPAELRADLDQLVQDMRDAAANDSQQVGPLAYRTADFVDDWHSHWMAHGPTAGGFAGFTDLLKDYRSDLGAASDDLRLASNGESFKEAARFTLDASLSVLNLQANSPGGEGAPVQRVRFDRPVFIVAAPRSGSTLLFETLEVNREFWSVGDESHKHFEGIPALRPSEQNPSNRLTADAATPDVVDTLINTLVADLINSDGQLFSQLPELAKPREVRFLEKTPKNSLRIPFILEAFPDARFIFLFRDARQNISSLLDSWRSRGYVTYQRLPGWPAENPWSHLLIPGWQEMAGTSLAETVAKQWMVTNQTVLDDLRKLPDERWCAIEYDSLLSDTGHEVQRLCQFSQIIYGPRMHEVASRPLKPSKYTLTAPQPDKWKKNAAELEPVLPATEPLMAALRELL